MLKPDDVIDLTEPLDEMCITDLIHYECKGCNVPMTFCDAKDKRVVLVSRLIQTLGGIEKSALGCAAMTRILAQKPIEEYDKGFKTGVNLVLAILAESFKPILKGGEGNGL